MEKIFFCSFKNMELTESKLIIFEERHCIKISARSPHIVNNNVIYKRME